ncbi:hypothetical protein O0I10_007304 [Lichtheimia ornata]|uniref:C2H2-type domain-containing protein n=1 Tax=Lichtheimia ornata TaxID=688661 RepID=A0AAD7V2B8_9FUNG|nr:uncharacterized protein O0I10_007304 [Lichtheimia ornata]KAJ8656970.1 hypothetical protein O0I10_007304 [Lichtheimia ornata]
MAPQKTRHNTRKPRLFQCTGYGDCHMVFTRSEHLARHARKHTGEKPFKCIMPDCNKMFSRFDNMMQHTQTHRSSSSPNNMGNTYQRSQRRRRTRISSIDTTMSTSSSSSSSNDSIDSATASSPSQPEDRDKRRRLSIAELCNPSSSSPSWPMSPTTPTDDIHHSPPSQHDNKIKLTADEMEALQALGRLHTTNDFFESLHDMITVGPSGNACACL